MLANLRAYESLFPEIRINTDSRTYTLPSDRSMHRLLEKTICSGLARDN